MTTRTNGNRKADQNTVAINFANLKQRVGETVADFKRRTLTILDSYDALELTRPRDIDVASRFLYGLEDCRYAAMKLYLGNESANGRDLYPSDLDAAATQASRWLAVAPRSIEYHPSAVTTFFAPSKPKTTIHTPYPNRVTDDITCEFCSRSGHTMEICFKFEAAKKAAKTPSVHTKGKIKRSWAHNEPQLISPLTPFGSGTEWHPLYGIYSRRSSVL